MTSWLLRSIFTEVRCRVTPTTLVKAQATGGWGYRQEEETVGLDLRSHSDRGGGGEWSEAMKSA